jgi:hypothetical protein
MYLVCDRHTLLAEAQHVLSLCSQVLHATAASKRDRTAVDALRALIRARGWFWQTLPFVYEEFPNLPCWDWPVFRWAT